MTRQKMAGAVRRLLGSVAQAVFPARCLQCGGLFAHTQTEDPGASASAMDFALIMAPYFCARCRQQWTAVGSPLCPRCGLVFKSRAGDDHLCGRCLERPGHFGRARAAGIYDGSLRTAIHHLKFKAAVHLADPLGRLLAVAGRRYWQSGDVDLVAPVPLHRRRFRRRGFNQAYLLLRRWPADMQTTVVRDLLVRHRATAPQTGLDRDQRRRNIGNAFRVRHPGRSAGKRVLLVDDVLTTGATVDACAAALLRDGACRVDVLTLARAL